MDLKKITVAATLAAMVSSSIATIALAQTGAAARPGMFVFDEVDANADGKVTKEELAAHRNAMIAAMDTDKDGTLSEAELLAAHQKRKAEKEAAREARMVGRMIERLDANKDGVLSVTEMTLPQNRAERMFDRADADGDGVISRDEAQAIRDRMAHRDDRHGDDDGGRHKGRKHDR